MKKKTSEDYKWTFGIFFWGQNVPRWRIRWVAANSCYCCWQFSPLHAATAPTPVSYLTGATHQLAPRREHGNSLHLSGCWSIFTAGSRRRTTPAKLRKTVNRGSSSKYRLGGGGGVQRTGRKDPAYATVDKPGGETCSLFSFTFILWPGCWVSAGFSEAPLGVRAAPARHTGLPLLSAVPLQSARTADLGACGESGRHGRWRAQKKKKKTHCNALMTHLSELGPGFLLLHSSVGHQIIEYFSWGGEERGGEEERRAEEQLRHCCSHCMFPLRSRGS